MFNEILSAMLRYPGLVKDLRDSRMKIDPGPMNRMENPEWRAAMAAIDPEKFRHMAIIYNIFSSPEKTKRIMHEYYTGRLDSGFEIGD